MFTNLACVLASVGHLVQFDKLFLNHFLANALQNGKRSLIVH